MTRHAREAISLAAATALGEAAMMALMTSDWSQAGAVALVLAFLIGPPLFLVLLAWRRRLHPGRSRLLFVLSVVVAVGGLGALGVTFYRFTTDPVFRQTPNSVGLVVPLVQWAVIMVVWVALVVRESREKRATGQPGQPADPPK